ncbi:aldehyde dehydrogenase (NADP(+)) [Pseudomonas machongensis]
MTAISGKNFIAGKRSATGSKTIQSLNATTGEALPFQFSQATTEEINQACEAAAEAARVFRKVSAKKRAEFLDAVAAEIEALGLDFVDTVCAETALPVARIQGEQKRTTGQLRLFAEVLRRGDFYGSRVDTGLPDRQPLPRTDLRQYKIGVGPVAVFGASNFPLAFSTAGGDTASAFAAGCPVVFKAHTGHMATSELVAGAITRAVEKLGLPAGVFSMIFGAGVGEQLVKHPGIKAVGFTGSLNGGRALCDMAAARKEPIPVFAEMSSINPVIILPGALAKRGDAIARELAGSVCMGAGQFCTNPGLVIGLQSAQYDQLLADLGQHLNAQAGQTMLNAGGLRSYVSGLEHLKGHSGVQHLAGQPQEGRQARAQLFKADARLLVESDPLLQEEVFGPTTVAVEVTDDAQLRAALLGLRGQLTATLIGESEDFDAFAWLVPLLEERVGRILVNGYPTGVEVCDAMVHGGPYPATSDARGTSVGTLAIDRWLRPVCYQNFPDEALPEPLKRANPLGIKRLVNGSVTQEPA